MFIRAQMGWNNAKSGSVTRFVGIFYLMNWTHTVTKVSAFSVLYSMDCRGEQVPIARNFLRLKIRDIAGYYTEPRTITSYSFIILVFIK